MYLDQHNIICLGQTEQNPKIFDIQTNVYSFSSQDKTVLVYHKNQIKHMQLKDVSQKMILYYLHKHPELALQIDAEAFSLAFSLFSGFDENTGESYSFLYKKGQQDLPFLSSVLQKYLPDATLGLDGYICKVRGVQDVALDWKTLRSPSQILSFLYGLACVYGTRQEKGGVLQTIKIHVPLFGIYESQATVFVGFQEVLLERGLFYAVRKNENDDGTIVEITITDQELLTQFVKWHESLATFTGIATNDLVEYHAKLLVAYAQDNGFANFACNIHPHCIKLLKK